MAYKFAFSYSRYTLWAKCPFAYKLQNIEKMDTGPTPKALLEGRKVHDDMAAYLLGKADLPDRAKGFSVFAAQLKALKAQNPNAVIIEEQMAFDENKLRVGWMSKNARYRFIWDAAILFPDTGEVVAVDWKTGKPYGSYDDQMEIFSVPAFWSWPEVKKVTGYLMYLDADEVSDPYVYTREQFDQHIWPKWRTNISIFENDTAFNPTPSRSACRFCEFGSKNLKVCQYEYK